MDYPQIQQGSSISSWWFWTTATRAVFSDPQIILHQKYGPDWSIFRRLCQLMSIVYHSVPWCTIIVGDTATHVAPTAAKVESRTGMWSQRTWCWPPYPTTLFARYAEDQWGGCSMQLFRHIIDITNGARTKIWGYPAIAIFMVTCYATIVTAPDGVCPQLWGDPEMLNRTMTFRGILLTSTKMFQCSMAFSRSLTLA